MNREKVAKKTKTNESKPHWRSMTLLQRIPSIVPQQLHPHRSRNTSNNNNNSSSSSSNEKSRTKRTTGPLVVSGTSSSSPSLPPPSSDSTTSFSSSSMTFASSSLAPAAAAAAAVAVATTSDVLEEGWKWRMDERHLSTKAPLHMPRRNPRPPLAVLDMPLDAVLDRISSFMRVNSISCFFKAEDGSVHCLTRNRTQFMLYLWRKENESSSKLVVEIERRQGCAIEMQRIRRGLFATFQTGQEPTSCSGSPGVTAGGAAPTNSHNRTVCSSIKRQYRERVLRKEINDVSRKRSCCEGILNCVRLLGSNCEDQQQLGMENLVCLTGGGGGCSCSRAVDEETTREVAEALIYEDDRICAGSLRDSVRVYFQGSDTKFNNGVDSEQLEFAERQHFSVMHSLALQALSNALEAVVKVHDGTGGNNKKHVDLSSEFWQEVLSALAHDLTDAIARAQDAALAAKCLSALEDLVPGGAVRLLVEDGLVPYLSVAHSFGAAHHLTLKQELEHLMGRLSA